MANRHCHFDLVLAGPVDVELDLNGILQLGVSDCEPHRLFDSFALDGLPRSILNELSLGVEERARASLLPSDPRFRKHAEQMKIRGLNSSPL